jgi:hypothetical protein
VRTHRFLVVLAIAGWLLAGAATAQVSWVKDVMPLGPDGRVSGDQSGAGIVYVCRGRLEDDAAQLLVGVSAKRLKLCSIGVSGKQLALTDYEVLVASEYVWMGSNDTGRPRNAVVAGQLGDGKNVYICVGHHPTQAEIWRAGYLSDGRNCAIGFDLDEIETEQYFVLTTTDLSASNEPLGRMPNKPFNWEESLGTVTQTALFCTLKAGICAAPSY